MENEYGSFGCDKVYLANLRDLIKDLVRTVFYRDHYLTLVNQAGDQVLLFSTDGDNEGLVMCGQVTKDKAPRLCIKEVI